MGKFVRKGKSKVYFLPTVAAYNPVTIAGSPTGPEIAAGTDLSVALNEMSGWEFKASFVDAPVLATSLTTKITGEDQLGEPTLTFLDDDASSTIRTALAKGVVGYIVLMPYGNVATKRAEVWPVQSAGVNDQYTVSNEPAKFQVSFSVTNPPVQGATLP